SYDLCLSNCPLVTHWTREIADVRDETLDHRVERSILQCHDDDRARPIRQIDRQHFDRLPVRVEAQERRWKHRDETTGSEHAEPHLSRRGHDAYLRHPQSLRSEGLCHDVVRPTVRRVREDPRLVGKLGEIDLATASRPWTGRSNRYDY